MTSMKGRSVCMTVAIMSLLGSLAEASAKPALTEMQTICPGPTEYREVWNAADLQGITVSMLADNSPDLKYRQCADIELPATGFFPIGRHPNGQIVGGGFRGEYLGQGYRISGQRPVAGVNERFGLFRELTGARISNLHIENTQYVGTDSAGALASEITGATLEDLTLTNIAVRSTNEQAGALAGSISGTSLSRIHVQAIVGARGGLARLVTNSLLDDLQLDITRDAGSGLLRFAGLAERISNSQLRHLQMKLNAAESTGLEDLAGIAFEVASSRLEQIVVADSMFPLTSSRVGGIAVKAEMGTIIERARVSTNLRADWQAGGLVARSEGATLRDNLFEGNIESDWAAGGIVGSASVGVNATGSAGTSVERCAVRRADIAGRGPVGGIVGELYSYGLARSSVVDSYALATVHNDSISNDYTNLGGIAGLPYGAQIQRVIFSGPVLGGEFVGGITGMPFLDSVVEAAIYNSDLLPTQNGEGTAADQTSMRQDVELYAAFDLNQIWSFSVGAFPELLSMRALRVDIDADTFVTQQDLFAFLSQYFAAFEQADFNGDGVVNPLDIFDYLSAWFLAR